MHAGSLRWGGRMVLGWKRGSRPRGEAGFQAALGGAGKWVMNVGGASGAVMVGLVSRCGP